MEKVIIIGAGPCGLSAAAELKKIGVDPLLVEKGCLVNSIYGYPTFMHFFSTPELLEIGNIPFTTANEKPSRHEALNYYSQVANKLGMRIRSYECVLSVERKVRYFVVVTKDRLGNTRQYETEYVVVATGYFDNPNLLNIPGEDLPKVSHYYKEAHPYQGMKVAVVGGKNSAVEAAMDLERNGAEVTVVYRGERLSDSVKPWVRPLFESKVNKGRIRVLWSSRVTRIEADAITIETEGRQEQIENDFVFALTGYRPDRELLTSMGVRVNDETGAPSFNEETMETNVPGIYVAGVISAGYEANVIFIENGRFHGKPIAEDIRRKVGEC